RYAPVNAGAQVQVAKVPGSVNVRTQRLLLLPMSLDVTGRVQSPLGPLKGALLTVRLGDWESTARSDADGRFSAHLDTGLSLTLFGAQQLSVVANPEEPWHETSSAIVNMMVINPVNIGGLVLAVVALALYGVRWMKRRPVYAVAPVARSAPAMMNKESPQRPLLAPQEMAVGPRAVLLAVYKDVLRLVQSMTAVALGPNRTLREFAQECGPRLGPLAGPFRELTLMMEKLLYSRHGAEESEAASGAELGRTLKEGLEREGS
ncbi:MAG: DUF4129 domain-containing protein, partial [Dehalococcoidia bacterium]|nr:DUF4129 domain-containing protein [Dehalococcoidia bacterium]